jgi:hypothetical protein
MCDVSKLYIVIISCEHHLFPVGRVLISRGGVRVREFYAGEKQAAASPLAVGGARRHLSHCVQVSVHRCRELWSVGLLNPLELRYTLKYFPPTLTMLFMWGSSWWIFHFLSPSQNPHTNNVCFHDTFQFNHMNYTLSTTRCYPHVFVHHVTFPRS